MYTKIEKIYFNLVLIKEMKKTNETVDINIFNSIHKVNLDTVIGYIKDDKKHSFLDEY